VQERIREMSSTRLGKIEPVDLLVLRIHMEGGGTTVRIQVFLLLETKLQSSW